MPIRTKDDHKVKTDEDDIATLVDAVAAQDVHRTDRVHLPSTIKSLLKCGLLEGNSRGEKVGMGDVVVDAIDRIENLNADGSFVLTKGGDKDKKSFRQGAPTQSIPASGSATRASPGSQYRLPELIEAVASNRLVFVVEGEGKVDKLQEIGITATTNPAGAGKWLPEMSAHLRGADVVLLPDNDEAGWKHAADVRLLSSALPRGYG